MPALQVTGELNNASLSHTVITYFQGNASQDIVSIGLFFEPNFFTAWFYADKLGEKCIGFERVSISEAEQYLKKYSDKQPAFATLSTERFTLMPLSVFHESDANCYLKLNTAFQGEGDVAWDNLPARDMAVIYHDVSAVQGKLDTYFPGLNAGHLASKLIEVLGRATSKGRHSLFIYGSDCLYYFLLYEGNGLKIVNAIDSQHADDLIYYTMYCIKQLDIKLPEVRVIGEADHLNALQEGISKYIPNVMPGIDGLSLGLKNLPASATELGRYFVGYTAQLCV